MTKDRADALEPAADEETRYGAELLSANWNPVIALLQWSCNTTLEHVKRESAASDDDIDGFLTRFYTLGA